MKKLLFSVLVALSLVCCTTGCSQEEIEYLNWTHFAWFNNSDYPVMLSVQNTRNEFIFQHERIEPGRKFEIVEYSDCRSIFRLRRNTSGLPQLPLKMAQRCITEETGNPYPTSTTPGTIPRLTITMYPKYCRVRHPESGGLTPSPMPTTMRP